MRWVAPNGLTCIVSCRIIKREGVLLVTGQPLLLVERRIPRLSCEPEAGDSYFAFNATMQIVTRKTNDKKSYRSISNAPLSGAKNRPPTVFVAPIVLSHGKIAFGYIVHRFVEI